MKAAWGAIQAAPSGVAVIALGYKAPGFFESAPQRIAAADKAAQEYAARKAERAATDRAYWSSIKGYNPDASKRESGKRKK